MALATRTLTARLHGTSGQALAGARLVATLSDSNGRPRGHFLPGGSILSVPVEATSGSDGVAALDLVPTVAMTPAGARYQLQVIAPDGAELSSTIIEMPDEDRFLASLGA